MLRLIWVFAGCTCHFVGFVMRRLLCFHYSCPFQRKVHSLDFHSVQFECLPAVVILAVCEIFSINSPLQDWTTSFLSILSIEFLGYANINTSTVAYPEGVWRVCSNSNLSQNYFIFIWNFRKKLGKLIKSNPFLQNLNPQSKNPGSTPVQLLCTVYTVFNSKNSIWSFKAQTTR